MKNLRKLTKNLLKITLGLLVISGCSNNSTEEIISSSTIVEPVSRIMVTPPASVVVGKEYNLDDYVDVVGGPGSDIYDVTVRTTTTAEVTDHTLKVIAEGTITLDISAGEQKSRFQTKAMTQIMSDYKDYTANIEYNYALIGHVYETNGLTHENYIHNDRYVLREYQESIGIVPVDHYEGLMEFRDGDVYSFEASEELTSESLDVNGAVLAATGYFHYFYVSMAFPASYEYFEYAVDSNGTECLVLDSSTSCTIDQYSDYFGGTMIGELYFLMYYGMCINTAAFAWDKLIVYANPTGEGFYYYWSLIEIATGNYYYISYDYLSTKEADYTRSTIDEFIDNGVKPEMPSISEAQDFLSGFKSAESYTVEINWYGYNFNTGKHSSNYEISTLYVDKENAVYLDYENIYNGESTTGVSGFVMKDDGKIYSFETNEGLISYAEQTEVTWDSLLNVATSNYLTLDSLDDATVSYRNVDAETGAIEVSFSDAMDFAQTFTTLLGNMGAKLTSRTDLTVEWWNYVSIDVITSADNSTATFTLEYSMYADEDQTEYLYCDVTVKNLNSTVLPSEANIIFA